MAFACATDKTDYPRYLLRLCELERIDRERRHIERRIRLARFPQTKSFDTFDFTAMPGLHKPLVLELARCEWIERLETCIALGPAGTGKTHTALAWGWRRARSGVKGAGLDLIRGSVRECPVAHVFILTACRCTLSNAAIIANPAFLPKRTITATSTDWATR